MRSVIAIGVIVISGGLADTKWPTADRRVQATIETGSTDNAALTEVLVSDAL